MTRLVRQKLLFVAAMLFLGALVLQFALNHTWFQDMHLRITNTLYQTRDTAVGDDIVIVAIDNASLERKNASEIGTLQFDKADYARVLENLVSAGASVIGVDVIFSEQSSSADQGALVEVLRKYDNIILAAEPANSGGSGLKPLKVFREVRPENVASIVLRPDSDNTVRREHVQFSDPEAAIAFDVRIVQQFLGLLIDDATSLLGGYQLMDFPVRLSQTRYEPIIIPLDETGSFLINYSGPPYSYPVISFTDVFDNQMVNRASGEEMDLSGRIVLIGEMGTGIHDQQYVPTSAGTPMPGVEIHAHALQTLLSQRFLHEYPSSWLLPSLVLLLFVSLLLFLFLPIVASIVMVVVLELGYLIAAFVAFSLGWVLNMVYPFLVIALAFVSSYVFRYLLELRSKKKTEKAFSRYVSEQLVKKILENPDQLKLGGEKKELTVFFSDVVSFTSISERLKPEQLIDQLNEYLELMSKTILRSEGTVDKFIGDSIMAFWGAPLPQKDHAVRACVTALEYQDRLDALNARWKKEGKVPFPARIGVNTGDLIVGNVGSSKRFDYTVIGDTVNLASRLEGANTSYGTRILLSETTYELAKDHIDVREIDLIRVKGKRQPVRIYELMGLTDHLTDQQQALCHSFAEGLQAYRKQDWKTAKKCFQEALHHVADDGPSLCYIERCEGMAAQKLPKKWDGVFTMTSK